MRQIYSQHSEGGDDLFVCDVCEAILVSAQGIVEHLQTQHREELDVMDIETISQETKARSSEPEPSEDQNSEASQTGEDSEGSAEGARAPKIDMTFVERQFYVCCHCDEVFLDKKHLHGHINSSHDLSEKKNDSPDTSTPQSPKPKRFKRRVFEDVGLKATAVSRVGVSQTQTPGNKMTPLPSVINTLLKPSSARRAVCLPEKKKKNEATSQGDVNANQDKNVSLGLEDNKQVKEDNTNKETKKDPRKSVGSKPRTSKKLAPQEHAIETSLPAIDKESVPCDMKKSKLLKVSSEVAMEYQCPNCGVCKDKKDTFKNHFLSHYKKSFTSILLSSPPYDCPEAECKNSSRDKISLMRHYAFAHKKMFTMTDVTENKFKEIMAKAFVPKD